MFRKLVAPLDGSELAEQALAYAVRLAQAGHGRLILTRVALAPPPRTLDGSDWEREQLEAIEEAETYLRGVADRLSDKVPVETLVAYGHAAEQILATVAQIQGDGVVMATHGRAGFAHLLYGSVTEAVLASSGVPVLVLYTRPGEAPAPPFSPETARLLVPQDGSAYDAPALEAAFHMLGPRGEIRLVTVVKPPTSVEYDESGHVLAYLDQQEEALRLDARDYLNNIAAGLRNRPQPVEVTVDVRMGDPTSGIAMASIDSAADLIVMATHGRTGIRRAVLGSVAGTVLRTGHTPVLMVHPHNTASAGSSIHVEKVEAPV